MTRLALTTLQQTAFERIESVIRSTGRAPTRSELAEFMGWTNRTTAGNMISVLRKKGWLAPVSPENLGRDNVKLVADPYRPELRTCCPDSVPKGWQVTAVFGGRDAVKQNLPCCLIVQAAKPLTNSQAIELAEELTRNQK